MFETKHERNWPKLVWNFLHGKRPTKRVRMGSEISARQTAHRLRQKWGVLVDIRSNVDCVVITRKGAKR